MQYVRFKSQKLKLLSRRWSQSHLIFAVGSDRIWIFNSHESPTCECCKKLQTTACFLKFSQCFSLFVVDFLFGFLANFFVLSFVCVRTETNTIDRYLAALHQQLWLRLLEGERAARESGCECVGAAS